MSKPDLALALVKMAEAKTFLELAQQAAIEVLVNVDTRVDTEAGNVKVSALRTCTELLRWSEDALLEARIAIRPYG